MEQRDFKIVAFNSEVSRHKPRNAGSHQKLEEAGSILPWSLGGWEALGNRGLALLAYRPGWGADSGCFEPCCL